MAYYETAIAPCPDFSLVTSVMRLLASLVVAVTASVSFAAEDEETRFFESKIRPVLVESCYECHSQESKTLKGGLAVDSRDAIRRGGDSGATVVPGEPHESLLLEAIRYESFEMPPTGKLPDEVIKDFERWIRRGALDPRDTPAITVQTREKAGINWDEAKRFWSFKEPVRSPPPNLADATTCRRPLDLFIEAKLSEAGIEPNSRADDRTLMRRMYYDLIGLPPTIAQAERFMAEVSDDREKAIESLVNELLASPHYGERWAALWLDLMRYAEDQAHIVGNNRELFYPNAYRYRAWVIESLNADLPYDEFVKLQLAADLLTPEDEADDVALGFLGLGPKYYRRNSPEVMADEWEDRVDTVSRGLLGLTVACARCHDHKYDPIPTEDYYAMAGVFAGTEMFNRPLGSDEYDDASDKSEDPERTIHIVRDQKPHDLHVMIRGDVNVRGELVPRRFLGVLSPNTPVPFKQGSGRLELAECIAAPSNPLTARVIVNRIWGELFGAPLVGTPSNFGELGERPTHPELLDDLAVRFMENDWSLKWLQRELVLSDAYQRSSENVPDAAAKDAGNRLLWRANRRRLEVEKWRDTLLCAAGMFNPEIGETSIDPTKIGEGHRTVYSYRSRFELHPLLARFDFPDPNAHSAGRSQTTTPLQKLFVLNSPWMIDLASRFAERVTEHGKQDDERIDFAYRILFLRMPSEQERRLGKKFLTTSSWPTYVHVLLASNELLVID